MRVHSTFNNTLSVHQKAANQAEKGAIVEGKENSKSTKTLEKRPPKQALSRGEILSRLKEHQKAIVAEAKAKSSAAQAKDETDKPTRAIWDKQVEASPESTEIKTAKEAQEKAESLSGESRGEGIKIIDTDEEVIGDVGKNKPDDPMTKSKLKQALSGGTFQFSDKERSALEQILGKGEDKS